MSVCLLCVASMCVHDASAADDYPEIFFTPVDSSPDPKPQLPAPSATAFLGIMPLPVPHNIRIETGISNGVYVGRVIDNTAATEMGIQEGDIIISINGQSINNYKDTFSIIRKSNSGAGVQIVAQRDGETVELSGIYGNRPQWANKRRGWAKKPAQNTPSSTSRNAGSNTAFTAREQVISQLHDIFKNVLGPAPLRASPLQFPTDNFAFSWSCNIDSRNFDSVQTAVVSEEETEHREISTAPEFHIFMSNSKLSL